MLSGVIQMRMYDIIDKKKYKKKLSDEEISFVVEGYNKGSIPDYYEHFKKIKELIGSFHDPGDQGG